MPVNYNSPSQRLNNQLDALLTERGIHLVREYRACPPRKNVWDFALPELRLLFEVQGGIWRRGKSGHTSGSGVRRDALKNNLAVLRGWRCFYITPEMIKRHQGQEAIAVVVNAINTYENRR